MHCVRAHTHLVPSLVLKGFPRWSPRPLGPTLEEVAELNSVRVHIHSSSPEEVAGVRAANILYFQAEVAGAPPFSTLQWHLSPSVSTIALRLRPQLMEVLFCYRFIIINKFNIIKLGKGGEKMSRWNSENV